MLPSSAEPASYNLPIGEMADKFSSSVFFSAYNKYGHIWQLQSILNLLLSLCGASDGGLGKPSQRPV